MGATKQFDWTLAKALFINGLTHKQIADKLGCSVLTVQQKSKKEQWRLDKHKSTQIHDQLGSDSPVDRWLKGIEELLERVTQNSLQLGSAKSRRDLKDDADTLRTLIVAGRQHFGLDNEASTMRIGIQVGKGGTRLALVDSSGCQLAMQVIDDQSIRDDGKAKGMEEGGIIDVKGNPPAAPAGGERDAQAP
jgi:hypothetical protein